MERLTTNKNVSEMSMIELAYNSCYVKDGRAHIRDFKNDFDARELVIKLLGKYADITNDFTCDEDFDEFMLDSLQYGANGGLLGLVAVFYLNLLAMAGLRERLKEYEDLEEQGRLPKLPCNIGDFVFAINKNKFIEFHQIVSIEIADDGIYCKSDCRFCRIDDFGKTVFFTREEAREALEKREVEGNDGE